MLGYSTCSQGGEGERTRPAIKDLLPLTTNQHLIVSPAAETTNQHLIVSPANSPIMVGRSKAPCGVYFCIYTLPHYCSKDQGYSGITTRRGVKQGEKTVNQKMTKLAIPAQES